MRRVDVRTLAINDGVGSHGIRFFRSPFSGFKDYILGEGMPAFYVGALYRETLIDNHWSSCGY